MSADDNITEAITFQKQMVKLNAYIGSRSKYPNKANDLDRRNTPVDGAVNIVGKTTIKHGIRMR